MQAKILPVLLRVGWRCPYIRVFSSRRAVILLYHGVSKRNDPNAISIAVFEQHIHFLKQHFEIIHPEGLLERRKPHEKIRVLLTFDDGFRNHAEVVVLLLKKHRVPALFFVSSRHSKNGKYLWFNYLRAFNRHFTADGFKFRGEPFNMSLSHRGATLSRLTELLLNLRPHPAAMYEAIENEFPALEYFVPAERLTD